MLFVLFKLTVLIVLSERSELINEHIHTSKTVGSGSSNHGAVY